MTTDLVPTSTKGRLKIYKADQIPRSGAMMMIYGPQGLGKTTLCATSPGRLIFLDYDRRTNVLANRSDIDIAFMDTIQDAENFFVGEPEHDVIVLDNASELAAQHFFKVPSSADPRQMYNSVQADMLKLFRKCRQYAHDWGIAIIWTAWEDKVQVLNDGTLADRTSPKFAPSLANNLLGLFQIVMYYGRVDGKRTLLLEDETGKIPVKWGVAPNDVAHKIPRKIVDPSLAPILMSLIGGKPYNS